MDVSLTAVTVALSSKIIELELRSLALEDLLLEKGVITANVLKDKYSLISSRDIEKLNDELIKRIAECVENDNETK